MRNFRETRKLAGFKSAASFAIFAGEKTPTVATWDTHPYRVSGATWKLLDLVIADQDEFARKCLRVIESCKSQDQLLVASEYTALCMNNFPDEMEIVNLFFNAIRKKRQELL